jgi:hypothetical protein
VAFFIAVILSDSEGSSSISRAVIQGEEDASFLSMTNVYTDVSGLFSFIDQHIFLYLCLPATG